MTDPTATVADLAATATRTPDDADDARALPDGWRWVRLGDVIADAQPGFASGARAADGVVQLRMNNVDTRGHLVWDSIIRVPANDTAIERYRVTPGDVVFNNTNSTELVGKSALFMGHDEPVVYSNHFTRLRPAPALLDPSYLAGWLRLQWQERIFEGLCNRWIGQSAVKNDKLLALMIPLPPLAEQRRIAAALAERLAAVERARAAARAQLDAARALPAAYLRAVFESDEARAWPRVRLGDVALVSGGLQKTPSRAPRLFHRPFLTVRNVQRGALDLTNVEHFEIVPQELEQYRLRPGDILIVEGNGSPDQIGRNAIFHGEIEDCIHQNHLIRVRLDRLRAEPAFVSRYLNSDLGIAQMLEKAQTTTGLHTLSVSKVQQIEVALPSVDHQLDVMTALDGRLNQAWRARVTLEQQLAAIEALPAALLRQAFRGEL